MKKRVLSFVLAMVMVIAMVPTIALTSNANTSSSATAQITATLERWKSKLNNKYWNYYDRSQWNSKRSEVENNLKSIVTSGNLDRASATDSELGVTTSACAGDVYAKGCRSNYFEGGWQCFGFAWWIEYALFQSTYSSNSSDWYVYSGSKLDSISLQPGDLVRMSNHSAVIQDVSNGGLKCVEAYGGSGCKIKWSSGFNGSKYTTANALMTAIKSKGGTVYRYKYVNSFVDNHRYLYEECKHYNCAAKIKILQALNPYTLPCNSDTATKFNTTSTALTDKALSAGDVVTATALYKNSEGNYWYKVTLEDGTSAYVYSKYTEALEMIEPSVINGSFPSNITGSTPLKGTLTAGGATIDMVRAVVYKGNTTSGTPILQSNECSVSATSYQLQNSDVDLSLPFQDLAQFGAGTYTLVIEATTSTFLGDGKTLGGMCSAGYRIADYYYFTYGSDPTQQPTYCTITFDLTGGTLPAPFSTRQLDGVNVARGSNQLIVYNSGSIANTNQYGVEVAVDSSGKVVAQRGYLSTSQLSIPNGGFVLSGQGNSGTWVEGIALGNYVAYDTSSMTVYVYSDQASYELNHGKVVQSGQSIGTLHSVTLDGYNFLGWATDGAGQNLINEAYTVTQDLTLYAIWQPIESTCEHLDTDLEEVYVHCQYEGYVLFYCKVCGIRYTSPLSPVDHTYVNGNCKYCGQTHPDCANGHSYTYWEHSDNETHYGDCDRCRLGQFQNHEFDDGTIITPATHTTEGLKQYKCISCVFTKDEIIPMEEHNFGRWIILDDIQHYRQCECGTVEFSDHTFSEWENCGSSHLRECSCGSTQYRDHEWDNGVVISKPTCSKIGETLYTCTVCNATDTEITSLTTPIFGDWQDHNMLQHKRVCECGETVEYADHNWDNGITVSGITTYTCYDCSRKMEAADTGDEPEIGESDPAIIVHKVKAVAGETVTVDIDFNNNPGLAGIAFDIYYDNTILELVSYNISIGNGMFVTSPEGKYNDHVNFQLAGMSNITESGTLVSFTFKVKNNAPEGVAEVKVIIENGTAFKYEGSNEVDLDIATAKGGVEVINYLPGDINGDGVVNNRDASRLLQKLASWDVWVVESALDVNGDGKVNIRDAARILQYLAGWNVELH